MGIAHGGGFFMHWFRENFVEHEVFGESEGLRPLRGIKIGRGEKRILITACHHANEFLTGLCLLSALEDYACQLQQGVFRASTAYEECTMIAVPWVNPDGAALLMGLSPSAEEERFCAIGKAYPHIPFPEGYKANLRGVDLNLNYPADWELARLRKGEQGFTSPAPRDFPGFAPLSERETIALATLTETFAPHVAVALHSQGEELYVNYNDHCPKGSRELGKALSLATGYPLCRTPQAADFAGFKDWFIHRFRRPGVTVELGLGKNPLPLQSFPVLAQKTRRILQTLLQST